MEKAKQNQLGKFVSLVLRHQPETIGLFLDKEGWADINELISKSARKGMSFTREELDYIVENNDKKRYAYNSDQTRIRANQGHSIAVDLQLMEKRPPEFLYHGTTVRFVESIRKKGILKMQRQQVHLSPNMQVAVQVGARRGEVFVFTVKAGEMYADGLVFFESDNGVWLTDFIDCKYLMD
ncbi:RNA 2'-phosphotransferase [Myroides pelagicus]|uniref:Probable RNA 2'-phosphotransferase n=1 Tax=Myroides pelagicus TaxID=270914 RepID=A0A7K1GNJ5_9FLAO|nr:RNA 2'-phosphotransferase [Myroides pelagicus]MTH30421.1 RNA 2'-phosphotransferase [Myroides pelagicus]